PASGSCFWIEEVPDGRSAAPIGLCPVDAALPVPTVGNGGISVVSSNWWPEVVWPGAGGPFTHSFFDSIDARVTALPPSAANPQGLIGGRVLSPADLHHVASPPPRGAPGGAYAGAAVAPERNQGALGCVGTG